MTKLSNEVLQTVMERYPILAKEKDYQNKWSYDVGVVLQGIKEAYRQTGESKYFNYIKENIDYYIDEDNSPRGYHYEDMNLDNINNGKLLFLLFQETKETKYKVIMDRLFDQLQQMPRTPEGGFWHKKIYPNQMWLDGLYMAEPFYAEYLLTFKNGEGLEDVIKQFRLCYEHTLDKQTGLLYHAWDSAKKQNWADSETGQSPHFLGRAMGWYLMALVDTMEIFQDHENKTYVEELKKIFSNCCQALANVRDKQKHVWFQILDLGDRTGNYLEASASSMIIAAMAKAQRLNILSSDWDAFIKESYQGLQDTFVTYTQEGWVDLNYTCEVAGLGGESRRDGTFAYYISEPIVTNDFKGYGAFLQATLAMEPIGAKNILKV